MPKPWARYEVNFINHDKFRAISGNAICLWLEGKNYADDKLTDGLLPLYEVKHWRFYGKKCVELLTTSCGVKPGTDKPYAPLWEIVTDFGFKMHDYLAHNDCRDKVQSRIDKAEEENARKKKNQAEYRERMRAERVAAALPPALPVTTGVSPITDPITREERSGVLPDIHKHNQNSELRTHKHNQKRELSVLPDGSERVALRAGELLERYRQDWYPRYRHGARLRLVGSPVEFQEAVSLCETWDDDRLEKLAQVVLTTDEEFIATTDRSFRIFALKASWADSRLTEVECRA